MPLSGDKKIMDMQSEKRPPQRIGRRVFLGMLAAGAGALVLPRDLFSNWFNGKSSQPEAGEVIQETLDNKGPDYTVFVDKKDPIPGSSGRFRIYAAEGIPRFDTTTWRLAVDGMVENPISLTYDQFRALPTEVQISDFKCVTGWEVKNLHWEGVRIRTLLEMVKPLPNARFITFYSMDGEYTDSLSLMQATYPEVTLAYKMGGQPLSARQGAPVRVIVPRMFGYKGVKWLNRMELTDKEILGYWEVRGYSKDAYRA